VLRLVHKRSYDDGNFGNFLMWTQFFQNRRFWLSNKGADMVVCPVYQVDPLFWAKNAFRYAMSTLRKIRTYERRFSTTFRGHRLIQDVCGSFLGLNNVYGRKVRAVSNFLRQKGVSGHVIFGIPAATKSCTNWFSRRRGCFS